MPQVNGVVRTLSTVATELRSLGHVVEVVGPDRFRNIPCPTYPDIRLAIAPGRALSGLIARFRPDALHIATEGPLGWAARRWAIRHRARFTTSFHTRFPEYLQARFRIPPALGYAVLRRFHGRGSAMLVATPSLGEELRRRRFLNGRSWSRGVDLDKFRPEPRRDWEAEGHRRPVFLYVGRVAVEKNIEAFLSLDLPGSRIVVGDGPQRPSLTRRFPDAHFTGPLRDSELSAAFAGADAFVFPSLTDTFGLVVLEALACGVPVAAFDVTGPKDILGGATECVGQAGPDLRAAALAALGADRAACRRHAERFGWRACAERFRDALVPLFETTETPRRP
ncbi:glycosyltransferase family 4 protein [Rhizosaccharibacter radicis]|uniref:Glycosyltransferase family 1 protein n=1 Tax=Rhizosaccharibacter radicis TaxID=2782605 RepID=A0ABT1VX87_9PROT|nr:glycosyltransferase family 1 protein [Acetobacteraceae bacterium KSS12]